MIQVATGPALLIGTPADLLPRPGERLPLYVPTTSDLFRLDPLLASKIDPQSEAGCWIWTGATLRCGGSKSVRHGAVKRQRRVWSAHRWTYTLVYGPIPEDREIHHECQTPLCVNPAHLDALHPDDHDWLHRELASYEAEARRAEAVRALVELTTSTTKRTR